MARPKKTTTKKTTRVGKANTTAKAASKVKPAPKAKATPKAKQTAKAKAKAKPKATTQALKHTRKVSDTEIMFADFVIKCGYCGNFVDCYNSDIGPSRKKCPHCGHYTDEPNEIELIEIEEREKQILERQICEKCGCIMKDRFDTGILSSSSSSSGYDSSEYPGGPAPVRIYYHCNKCGYDEWEKYEKECHEQYKRMRINEIRAKEKNEEDKSFFYGFLIVLIIITIILIVTGHWFLGISGIIIVLLWLFVGTSILFYRGNAKVPVTIR